MKINGRVIARVILSVGFIWAGIWHFIHPQPYIKIMPEYLPAPEFLVFLSGLCEIVGGIILAIPKTRKIGAYGLIAVLVAVFPANIHMAFEKINFGWIPVWAIWLRLPLQFVLIWLCWWSIQEPRKP